MKINHYLALSTKIAKEMRNSPHIFLSGKLNCGEID